MTYRIYPKMAVDGNTDINMYVKQEAVSRHFED